MKMWRAISFMGICSGIIFHAGFINSVVIATKNKTSHLSGLDIESGAELVTRISPSEM